MEKTIYNTFIRVKSQEQCDRLKQFCAENGLPTWDDFSFITEIHKRKYDLFYFYDGYFCNYLKLDGDFEEVTEVEWMELLKKEPLLLKQRIDKAIEYLESFNEEDRNQYLINILRYGKRMD
jgi:hypothetical protein